MLLTDFTDFINNLFMVFTVLVGCSPDSDSDVDIRKRMLGTKRHLLQHTSKSSELTEPHHLFEVCHFLCFIINLQKYSQV